MMMSIFAIVIPHHSKLHFSASKKILVLIVKNNKKTLNEIKTFERKVAAVSNEIPIQSNAEKERMDEEFEEANAIYGQNDTEEEDEEEDDDLTSLLSGVGLSVQVIQEVDVLINA